MKNVIRFKPNTKKILEVLLWLMSQKKEGINMYNMLKMLFYADCYHLNKYMRPVTGDEYKAMPYGTVPELAYNLLKGDEFIMCDLGISKLPFKGLSSHFYTAARKSDNEYLSESDIEALQKGYNEYADLNFEEVKKKNHENEAYVKAITVANKYIRFEDLIHDKDVLKDLKENSQYISL